MTLNPFGRAMLAAGALLGAAVVAILLLKAAGIARAPLARMGVMLPVIAAGLWLGGRYWGRLDEVAREAQKAAWFWGGSLGSLAAFIGVMGAVQFGWTPTVDDPRELFILGAVAMVLTQTAGFFLAWGVWWARNR